MEINNVLVTREDKKNFLKGLIRVSRSDALVVKEEQDFFVAAALQMGLSDEDVIEVNKCWGTEEKINVVFSSKKAAYFFVREGMQLCAVDKRYLEVEKNEMFKIADELQLRKDYVLKLQNWVEEGMRWQELGNSLLEEIIKDCE